MCCYTGRSQRPPAPSTHRGSDQAMACISSAARHSRRIRIRRNPSPWTDDIRLLESSGGSTGSSCRRPWRHGPATRCCSSAAQSLATSWGVERARRSCSAARRSIAVGMGRRTVNRRREGAGLWRRSRRGVERARGRAGAQGPSRLAAAKGVLSG